MGVIDFGQAPQGALEPTWLAWAPDPAPQRVSEGAFRELLQGEIPGDLPLPPTRYRVAIPLPLADCGHAWPPILILSADTAPDNAALSHVTLELREALSTWRRRQLAERVLAAVEQLPDPLEITDRDARVWFTNRAWTDAFGHEPGASFGQSMPQLFRDPSRSPNDRAFYQFTMAQILRGEPWIGTLACRTAAGEQRVAEVHVGPFRAPEFSGHVAVRRRCEHRETRDWALSVAHQEFRQVLSALPTGVAALRRGAIYFVNQAFLEMVGREERDVIGQRYADLVHSEDRGAIEDLEPAQTARARFTRPDGRPRIAVISVVGVISFEGEPADILTSLDVTDDRVAAEMLARAERLSALGALAAALVHEINNPLAYLLLNLHNFRHDHGPDLMQPGLQSLDEAIGGAERIRRIATDLREFSGTDPAEATEVLEIVDVTSAVTSALNIANNKIRHRATLTRDLADGARALAREGPLVQVLISLLVNAAQAIPEGDSRRNEVRIESRIRNQKVLVSVTDTGVGIPAHELPRVFDPFYTSKPRTEGSGLGLSIARRIIERYDGTIEIASSVGIGTAVTITLPQVAGAASPQPSSDDDDDPPSFTRARVLVVDDEPQLARALERVLQRHDVVATHLWEEAAQALDESAPFDVILCDLMMPGRSGADLYRYAVERHPRLHDRFLFMTGGAFADDILQFLRTWPLPVLEKPFPPLELHNAIQAIVGRLDDPEA